METRLTDAEIWEALIPTMGVFALARNLRGFDEAKISKESVDFVCSKFEDPEIIAKSRMFPYRWMSAYTAAPSLDWGKSLSRALDLSCSNVPELPGRSLILIDTSGSMQSPVSERSQVQLYAVGALFAAVLSKRCEKVDVAIFGNTAAKFNLMPGESVLKYVGRVQKAIGSVGHGTQIWGSVAQQYQGHDRVCIFTDMQTMDAAGDPHPASFGYGYGYQRNESPVSISSIKSIVDQIPFIHGWNLQGYHVGTLPQKAGRWEYGGFTDATFTLLKALEDGAM